MCARAILCVLSPGIYADLTNQLNAPGLRTFLERACPGAFILTFQSSKYSLLPRARCVVSDIPLNVRGSCRDARARNVCVCLCVCGAAFEEVADRGCGGFQGKHIKYHIKGVAVCF